MNQMWNEMTCYERHNNLSDNMTSSKSAENLKPDQHRHGDGIAKMLYGQHFPKNQSILSSSTPNLSNSLTANTISIIGSPRLTPPLKPLRKHFYLPEEKIHSNELVKIRQHFDKSCSKQNSSGISNTEADSVAVDENENEVGETKNHSNNITIGTSDSMSAGGALDELKGKFPSPLNESYQKISRADDSLSYDAMKNNESLDADFNLHPLKPTRITAQAIIKSNNSISCGGNNLKCGENESDLVQQQDDDDDDDGKDCTASPSLSSSRQKHHRSKDLKPIKSLTASDWRRNQLQNPQQQQHNLILMNDDCKLLQVQDEQAYTSTDTGTCADKYCKNSSRAQHDKNVENKNYSKINEISTTNSRINRKHNLNLDLYFDKELSAWLSERDRQIESKTDSNNKFPITNIQTQSVSDMTTRDGDGDEWNSTEKLSNDTTPNVTSHGDDDNSSNSLHHFDDSFSSPESTSSSSIPANSVIDTFLIDTRQQDGCRGEKVRIFEEKKSQIFTDGEYFYGPYDFDLFSNEFYQFRDGDDKCDKCANDDEAGKLGNDTIRVISSSGYELLKNHDEVDNNAEVSLVRDVDVMKGYESLRNSCSYETCPNIEINVTNWSDNELDFTATDQRDDDVAFNRNFNYASTLEACDHNLIDLMDEGENDVSNIHRVNPYGDLQVVHPTIENTIYSDDNFDAPFNPSVAEVQNS